jgi:hypothetical protein
MLAGGIEFGSDAGAENDCADLLLRGSVATTLFVVDSTTATVSPALFTT